MKRILLPAALAVALTGSLAFAVQPVREAIAPQLQGHHQHDPHKAAQKIGQKLNLTPDQTAKLEPILAEREQKVSALRANTSLSEADRHTQIRAIHEESRKQFASILTPEQMQQLKSMHRGHGRRGGGNEAPAA